MRNPLLATVFALSITFPAFANMETQTGAAGAAPAGVAQPAAAQPAAQASPSPTDTKLAVAEKIKADWPKYDTGAKGHLTRPELAKWLTDLRLAAGQSAPDLEWQKKAFVQTDTNNDTKISFEELTSFLTGGA